MIIEDFDAGRSRLSNVGLGLTEGEARELKDSLDALLGDLESEGRHEHVSAADYQTEVTIWLVQGGEPTSD